MTRASSTVAVALPRVIVDAGPVALGKSVEFFAGQIANDRTRVAYAGTAGQFLGPCESRALGLEAVPQIHVAGRIRTHPGSAPTAKQHLARRPTAASRLVFGIFAALAEFERELIRVNGPWPGRGRAGSRMERAAGSSR